MIAPLGLVPWLVAMLVGSIAVGIAAGIPDAWREVRNGGRLAHSGDWVQVEGTMAVLVLSAAWTPTAVAGLPDEARVAYVGVGTALLISAVVLPVEVRGLAAGGVFTVVVTVTSMRHFGHDLRAGGPIELVAVVGSFGFGGIAGWLAAEAAADISGRQGFLAVFARSRTLLRQWQQTVRAALRGINSIVPFAAVGCFMVGVVVESIGLGSGGPIVAILLGLVPVFMLLLARIVVWIAGFLTLPAHVAIALCITVSASVRTLAHGLVRVALILTRHTRALCDSCLRMDPPLASRYKEGVRYCSKCAMPVSYEGGKGKLIAVFSDAEKSRSPRVFVRRAQELVAAGAPVDVTHIRLSHGFAESEVERLAAFLLEHPPSHPPKRIGVYVDGDGVLKPYLRNLLSEHFSWADQDPL